MDANRKFRFLVWLCLRLRLSIALRSGYSVTTFKLSNDAMAPELNAGDIVAANTGPSDRPLRVGDLVVASIKCSSWDLALAQSATEDRESLAGDSEQRSSDPERRLVVRKIAAIAGDPIPVSSKSSRSEVRSETDVVPEGHVYLLANDPSQGPDSRFADVGPRPLSEILGRIVAIRKKGRIIWLD